MPIDDEEDLLLHSLGQTLEEAAEGLRGGRVSWTMKRNCLWGLMAESLLRENRAPVTSTTGVFPTGAQVWPLW